MLLRGQVLRADLLEPPRAHLQELQQVPRGKAAGRGAALAVHKATYVQLSVAGVVQRTPAVVGVASPDGALPASRLEWHEQLELGLPADTVLEDEVLRVRLMEKDLPPNAAPPPPMVSFEGHSGYLTCPDLGRSATAEDWQRGMLYFVLGKHTLRFYTSKEESEKPGSGSAHGYSLAKAVTTCVSSKFNNCFEIK